MSKALTHETTWRERSGSHATKGSKRGVNLLGWEEEEWLSAEQERAALVARVQQVVALCTTGKLTPEERERLGREQIEIQRRITAIRPKGKRLLQNMPETIIEVVKERLTKSEFDAVLAEARRRVAKQSNAMAANESPAQNTAE